MPFGVSTGIEPVTSKLKFCALPYELRSNRISTPRSNGCQRVSNPALLLHRQPCGQYTISTICKRSKCPGSRNWVRVDHPRTIEKATNNCSLNCIRFVEFCQPYVTLFLKKTGEINPRPLCSLRDPREWDRQGVDADHRSSWNLG